MDLSTLLEAFLFGLAVVFILIGTVGVIVPVLPGILLVWLSVLAYAIFVVALVHAIDVGRTVKDGGVRFGAFVLFAAIVLQIALGIATLLWVVPLSLALLHQAMAMLVLTAASVHAAHLGRARRVIEIMPPRQNRASVTPRGRFRLPCRVARRELTGD